MSEPQWVRRDDLGAFANARGLTGYGVEVGVQNAGFSQQIMSQWEGKQLILVDAWRGLDDHLDCAHVSDHEFENQYGRTRRRMKQYGERVRIIRALSVEAAATFADDYLDFVYIDANHAYLAIKADMAAWWPKLKPGGLFSGHDYFNATPNVANTPDIRDDPIPESLLVWGVKPAVEEFADAHGKEIRTTYQDFSQSWWFFK